MPAALAARWVSISPSGQSIPASPVGPISAGSASFLPNSSMERSTDVTPLSGRGTRHFSANAASLRDNVTSSSAPPSTKSKIGRGSTPRAALRNPAPLK